MSSELRPRCSTRGGRGTLSAGILPLVLAASLGVSGQAFAQDVAVYGAPTLGFCNIDISDYLMCTGLFPGVKSFDASFFTPTLADLQQYHAIAVYSDLAFADPEAFGDVLADYVESGGGVVLGAGALSVSKGIGGRFAAEYLPVTKAPISSAAANLIMTPLPAYAYTAGPVAGHPILYGLNFLDGGSLSLIVTGSALNAGALRIADWSNGQIGVAVSEPGPTHGRVVALNLHLPSSACDGTSWAGDGDQLLARSLLWAARLDTPPAGTCANVDIYQDYNCNGIDVDDEPLIDETDLVCLGNIDPATGEPFPNNDWYYDYESYGCDSLVDGANFHDVDFDQLTGFVPPMGPQGLVQAGQISATLVCDNCVFDFNPNQQDMDCDNIGDLCDNCVYTPNEDQNNGQAPFCLDDGDCHGTACDNCACVPNPDQSDIDADGVGDVCDNCLETSNPDQADPDEDFAGTACDNCEFISNPGQGDVDFDNVGDLCDNCPNTVNSDQANSDKDSIGDACDNCPLEDDPDQTDTDGDLVGDLCDNCSTRANTNQSDGDLDGKGDSCDNCPTQSNGDQADSDGDGIGDVCDNCADIANDTQSDSDEDGTGDECDNCPDLFNESQANRDGDLFGDDCDLCPASASEFNIDQDGDGVGDICDNCPTIPNADQADDDGDDLGDVCDTLALRGGGEPSKGCNSSPISTVPAGFAWMMALGALALRRRKENA